MLARGCAVARRGAPWTAPWDSVRAELARDPGPDYSQALVGPATAGAVDRPLAERDAELSAIDAAIDAAGEGTGSVLLIEGPAGIGKTALAGAARARASAAGLRVLHGSGTELERAFAFGVVRPEIATVRVLSASAAVIVLCDPSLS